MPSPLTLTQRDLNHAQCADPRCNHENDEILFLHATCHMAAGLDVSYDRKTASLTLKCQLCKRVICMIGVHH